jgi:hypothetical protein
MKSSRPNLICRRIVRVVHRIQFLDLAFRVILDRYLERTQHRHAPQRGLVERLANAELKHSGIDRAIGLGYTDAFDEIADRFWRHAAPAKACDGRHARIVPAGDMAAAHQLGEHALRQDRVCEIEPRELILMRLRRHVEIGDEPIV